VSASALGPVQYPLIDLTPERFESLVFLLARATDPRVVPVRVKDGGLDARLPSPRGSTLRGWQAKRFTDGIHWGQCQDSARRAIAFWRPPHITFCFASDLSAIEQEKFRTELVERFARVRLDFWPASELQRLIRDTEDGQRAAAWLFENREAALEAAVRATAVGGPLQSMRHAAERQGVIQEYMDRDPHVQYTTVSRSPGGPETPAASQTFLSVTLVVAGQEVRFDASERYAGALDDLGGRLHLAFSDDEDGRRARETVERLEREGGTAKVSAGLGATMPAIPVGLQGLVPENGLWGEALLEIGSSAPASAPVEPQPVLVRAGGVELGVVLTQTDGPDGWEGTLGGGAGGVELFFSVRKVDGTIESRLDWRYTRGVGSGLEQLLACQVMAAGLDGQTVELLRPDGAPLASGTFERPDKPEEWRRELAQLETFLGYVAELEAWLGQGLDPPSAPTEEDARTLGSIVPLIRKPENPITWRRVELAPGAVRPASDGPFQFAVLQPLFARLFGQEVYVGMEMLHFPEGRIEGDGDELAVVPIGEEGIGTSRLHHPDEAPSDAAAPPG
jgi:hypothetical protein